MSMSQQPVEPPRVAVVKALNKFIDASIREKRTLLLSDQALLLSNTAEQILTTRISNIQVSGDQQRVINLKLYHWILRKAREADIPAAIEELDHLVNPSIRQILFTLLDCLAYPTSRERLHCFEEHPELLKPDFDRGLETNIAFAEKNTDHIVALGSSTRTTKPREMQNTVAGMRDHLEILRDARRRGGTITNLREAFVDMYGGRALDVPSWFAEAEAPLIALEDKGPSEEASAERIRLLNDLLRHSQKASNMAREILAELYYELAETLLYKSRYVNELEVYEAVIANAHKALEVYTRSRYPHRFTLLQKFLGNAYAGRIKGIRKENLELAIVSYKAALEVFTKETSPRMWAETQLDLAMVYSERIEGVKKENSELAILSINNALQVFTRETFPIEWASAQHALANAYFFRIEGLQKDNVERAIMHFHTALQEVTRENSPYDWATVHYSLGNCYLERIVGMRKDNLEQAIAYYSTALTIHTREAFSANWALSQLGL